MAGTERYASGDAAEADRRRAGSCDCDRGRPERTKNKWILKSKRIKIYTK